MIPLADYFLPHLGREVRGTSGSLRFVGRLVGISESSVTIHFGATNLTLPSESVHFEDLGTPAEKPGPKPGARRAAAAKKEVA